MFEIPALKRRAPIRAPLRGALGVARDAPPAPASRKRCSNVRDKQGGGACASFRALGPRVEIGHNAVFFQEAQDKSYTNG